MLQVSHESVLTVRSEKSRNLRKRSARLDRKNSAFIRINRKCPLNLIAIRYSDNAVETQRFYEVLGFSLHEPTSSEVWREMRGEIGSVVIHPRSGDSPDWEISFETVEALESIQKRLSDCQFDAGSIHSEEYGRFLLVEDPDGARIRINQLS